MTKTLFSGLFFVLVSLCSVSFANDLDDGIGLDEEINDDLTLKPNTAFSMRKSKSKFAQDSKIGNTILLCPGNYAFGSQDNKVDKTNILMLKKNDPRCLNK